MKEYAVNVIKISKIAILLILIFAVNALCAKDNEFVEQRVSKLQREEMRKRMQKDGRGPGGGPPGGDRW
jgi:hypothetical protein